MTDATITTEIAFRPARSDEASFIASLVNSAYRGEASKAGWTTEADLLEGQRTDEEEIRALINAPDSVILLCVRGDDIVGSVYLRKEDRGAYLGLLVVRPVLQGLGVGKRFMQEAEEYVRREWGSETITMSVLTVRHELIAFYERRGFRRTGERKPFETALSASTPRVENLEFESLEKHLMARPT